MIQFAPAHFCEESLFPYTYLTFQNLLPGPSNEQPRVPKLPHLPFPTCICSIFFVLLCIPNPTHNLHIETEKLLVIVLINVCVCLCLPSLSPPRCLLPCHSRHSKVEQWADLGPFFYLCRGEKILLYKKLVELITCILNTHLSFSTFLPSLSTTYESLLCLYIKYKSLL